MFVVLRESINSFHTTLFSTVILDVWYELCLGEKERIRMRNLFFSRPLCFYLLFKFTCTKNEEELYMQVQTIHETDIDLKKKKLRRIIEIILQKEWNV